MKSRKSRIGSEPRQGFSLPDMAPFAGLFFLLVYFYMLTSHAKGPVMGIVADSELPKNKGNTCTKGIWPGEHNGFVISLDKAGHFSVAILGHDALTQYAILKHFAFRRGITFTVAEEGALKTLPYLATSVQSLPKLLRIPGYQLDKFTPNGPYAALDAPQMIELLNYAQEQGLKNGHKFQVFLRIGGTHSASAVMRLTELLNAQCLRCPIMMVDAS